jgi:hypothetical protein
MNAMTKPEQQAVQGHDSEDFNTSNNPSISDVIEARLSRRSLFKAGFGTAGTPCWAAWRSPLVVVAAMQPRCPRRWTPASS